MICFQHRPPCVPVSHSSSRDSEEPVDRQSSSERPASTLHPELPSAAALQENTRAHTPAPTSETQTAAEQQATARSTSRSEAGGGPRSSTRGPTLKPPRSTEPPFIGDAYTSEDVPPQTVSSPNVQTSTKAQQSPSIQHILLDISSLNVPRSVQQDPEIIKKNNPGSTRTLEELHDSQVSWFLFSRFSVVLLTD